MWGELKRLDDRELAAVERALTGELGRPLIDLMAAISMASTPRAPDEAWEAATRLGWIADRQGRTATPVGLKIGDSCREFLMWEERARRIHEADRLEVMNEATFQGRRVAELGCGFGCNLLSLEGIADEIVGVEIEPIYIQVSPILSRVAGLPAPKILQGSADRTGLQNDTYDVVLNLGALQYMPIEAVLAETARILKPGGLAVMILSHLAGFLAIAIPRLPKQTWRTNVREAVTIAGMITYPWIGRAFTRPSDPVHPTRRRMKRWLADVGLRLDEARTTVFDHETCYVAVKQ